LKVDTNVLEEHAASFSRAKVSRVEIWSGYVGRLQEMPLRSTHRKGRGDRRKARLRPAYKTTNVTIQKVTL
jgi:hypothetical protein